MASINTNLSPQDVRALLQRLVEDDDFYARAAANPADVLREEGLIFTDGPVTLPSKDTLKQAVDGMAAAKQRDGEFWAFLSFVAFFGAAHFFHMATMSEPDPERCPQ